MTIKRASLILVLLSACLGLRLIHFSADPPVPIPADGAFFTDQGWHNHNALNKIQTGDWFFVADRNEITHMALFQFIQYGCARMFGVRYWVFLLQPLVASLLVIGLFGIFINYYADSQKAMMFTSAMAINYLHIVYSRAALVEPTVTFFILCSFLFWWLSFTRKVYTAAISGLFLFLAVITKTHGLYMLAFYTLAGVYEFVLSEDKGERKRLLLRLLLLSGTFIILYFLWKTIWINPNFLYWKSFGTPHVADRLPNRAGVPVFSIMKQYTTSAMDLLFNFQIRMPVITALAIIGIFMWSREMIARNRFFHRNNRLFGFCCLWLISGCMFFVAARYIRPRFQMMLLAPMVVIAVKVLFDEKITRKLNTVLDKGWYGTLAVLVGTSGLYKVFSVKTAAPADLRIVSYCIFIGFLIWFGIAGFKNDKSKLKIGCIVLYVFWQGVPYLKYMGNPSYTTVEIGRTIKRILVDNDDTEAYVLGPLGPTFALEGNFKTVTGGFLKRIPKKAARLKKIRLIYSPEYLLSMKDFESDYNGNDVFKLTELEYKVTNAYTSDRTGRKLHLYKFK